jgi:hypothetical protein
VPGDVDTSAKRREKTADEPHGPILQALGSNTTI